MRLEFKELGEGYFVEIKDPKKLKWKEQKAITAAFVDETLSSQLTVAERVAIALIKSGYMLDEDTNAPIQFPLNEESVGEVPSIVIEKVSAAFAESKTAEKN
jgi:hypothetical protein